MGVTMLGERAIEINGTKYLWQYRPDGPANECWNWTEARTYNDVSPAISEQLREYFLSHIAPGMIATTSPYEKVRLFGILESMGVADTDLLSRFGLHKPEHCRECRELICDGYSGPRCATCHEQFFRTARVRNAGNNDVSGGRMS